MPTGAALPLIVYAMFPAALIVSLAVYLWKERNTPARKRSISHRELFKGVGWILLFLLAAPPLAMLLFFGAAALLAANMAHPKDAAVAVAAAGFGLLMFFAALVWTAIARKVSRWPVTRGRIVAAQVESRQGRWRRQRMYAAAVRYTYDVDGRQYSGHRLRHGGAVSWNIQDFAQETVAKYRVGSKVSVYYNPQNPEESVLHPRSWGHYLLWLIAASLFVLAFVMATGVLR